MTILNPIHDVLARSTLGQPTPVVGMGATILCHSDRHAATITKVFGIGSRLAVEVTRDLAKRTDKNGMSECQTWEFTTIPDGPRYTFRYDGVRWTACYRNENGRWVKSTDNLRIGERDEYYDFSF